MFPAWAIRVGRTSRASLRATGTVVGSIAAKLGVVAAVSYGIDQVCLDRPERVAGQIVQLRAAAAGGPSCLPGAVENVLAADDAADVLGNQPAELGRGGAAAELAKRRRLEGQLLEWESP